MGSARDLSEIFLRRRRTPERDEMLTLGLRAHPLPRGVHVDVQQHRHVALERRAHACRADAATAQREHRLRRRLRQQFAHELLLGRAERLLAVQRELVRDGVAKARSEQLVAVERRGAECLCQLTRAGRLARPHEADQDECHPIRSV